MMEARYAYQRWGAVAKVKHLDESYPQLLGKTSTTNISSVESRVTDASEGASSALDLLTVMKASQTISGEMVLEKLLRQMIRIVIENAGHNQVA